jgi:hypothetical protein
MKSYLVLTENGPLLILTSMESLTEEILLDSLHSKGIDKFIAYEVPVEKVHEIYGVPFEIISADLKRGKDLRVVDFDGPHIFSCLSFTDLGRQIQHEACIE